MKRVFFLPLLTILLAVAGAGAQDVHYNFDRQADFSKFKTYKWVVLKNAARLDDLLDKQIKAAVDQELAKKGLTKVEDDSANLYIGYQAAVGQEKEFTSYSSDWGFGGGWYGPGGGSTTTGQTSTIYKGQLAVDMYDSSNHTLVWRGLASKTLDPKAKPDKQEKHLQKTVAKLLKNYPPEAKK
jgi:Domain of unknown function (DUF4136)